MNGLALSPNSFENYAPGMPDPDEISRPVPKANGLATTNPYQPPAKPMQNGLLGATLDAFQRGFAPQAREQRIATDKAQGVEKAKQTLALMQQQRALPVAQRTQWWQQNAPQIAQITGVDTNQQIDPEQFTDQALDGNIAALSGQLGIAPDKPTYQFLNQANGGISRADPRTGQVEQVIQPTPDPVKPTPKRYVQQEFNGKVWMVNQEDPTDKYELGKPNPSTSSAVQDSFRPATPEELKRYGIPPGTAVKINMRTGEPQVVTGARPASEFTQKQQNDFVSAARTTDALEGAVRQYEQLIDENGPQLWTTGPQGDNPTSAKLDAARTNVDIQIKELFNLGVLNGPDLDIIRGAIPDATGFEALGKNPTSVKASLGVVHDYISRARNQIPQQFIDKARPHGDPFTKPPVETSIRNMMPASMRGAVPQSAAQPTQPQTQAEEPLHPQIEAAINAAFPADEGDADQVPEGWDPEDWKYLTPQEKQQALGQ